MLPYSASAGWNTFSATMVGKLYAIKTGVYQIHGDVGGRRWKLRPCTSGVFGFAVLRRTQTGRLQAAMLRKDPACRWASRFRARN